jgi:hypothetical protein
MRVNPAREPIRFLHGPGNASVALVVAVLLLLMDLVPLHRTVSITPVWMKDGMRDVLIPLLVAAMTVVIWRIRSLWESVFLGVFVADIAFKGMLFAEAQSFFRGTVSPLLWGVAALIAAGLLISSLKGGGPPETSI